MCLREGTPLCVPLSKQGLFGLLYVNGRPLKDRTNLTVLKSPIKCNYNLVEKPLMEVIDCSVEARNLLAKRPQSHHMVIDLADQTDPHFLTQWTSWR